MTYTELRERETILIDSWGQNRYVIAIGAVGTTYFLVHANNLQDAIDVIVDETSEDFPGFFADENMIDAYYDETHEDYAYMQDMYFPAGNESKLFTSEIYVLHEDNKGRR